ncbi:MAG TPA: hypothetical protein VJ873_08170, partial [bacterium]|nr:hypothetical protein [bacterium]
RLELFSFSLGIHPKPWIKIILVFLVQNLGMASYPFNNILRPLPFLSRSIIAYSLSNRSRKPGRKVPTELCKSKWSRRA